MNDLTNNQDQNSNLKHEYMPKVWSDADGVLVNFAKAVYDRIGVDPDQEGVDAGKIWYMVKQEPDFWQTLELMPGAQKLWDFIKSYDPTVLTGVGGDPIECDRGKKASMFNFFNTRKVVVTNSSRKPEFLRAGDILLDDKQANLDPWIKQGGIGVLYQNSEQAIDSLQAIGLLGDGQVSLELLERVKSLREDKPQFKREGYTGYIVLEDAQKQLLETFGVLKGVADNGYRLVCNHVTRCFPAGLDTVDNANPLIKIVGEFESKTSGHHVLVCEIDGQIKRPREGYYHLTYAMDDSEAALEWRKQNSLPIPRAHQSNQLLETIVKQGSEKDLYNLPEHKIVSIKGEFRLLDLNKINQLPKARTPIVETVVTELVTFTQGEGVRTERTREDIQTVTVDYKLPDGSLCKHCETGPAIERTNKRTGQVLYQAWFLMGKKVEPFDLNSNSKQFEI